MHPLIGKLANRSSVHIFIVYFRWPTKKSRKKSLTFRLLRKIVALFQFGHKQMCTRYTWSLCRSFSLFCYEFDAIDVVIQLLICMCHVPCWLHRSLCVCVCALIAELQQIQSFINQKNSWGFRVQTHQRYIKQKNKSTIESERRVDTRAIKMKRYNVAARLWRCRRRRLHLRRWSRREKYWKWFGVFSTDSPCVLNNELLLLTRFIYHFWTN